MLRSLTIDNYVLIDHLDVTFPGGLVIITGETGAGKSILLGALSLLLGAKADVASLMDAGRNCIVEACFVQADGEHFIRRVIAPSGRSRSFYDDEPVTLESLRERSSSLVDIHSQNQQALLSQRDFRLGMIDSFADDGPLLEVCRSAYDLWQKSSAELAVAKAAKASFEKEREYLEFQLQRLEDARLSDGELERLEAEQLQLANSGQIKESFDRAFSLFDGEEISMDSRLKEVAMTLERISEYVPEAASLGQRVETCRVELKDIADDLALRGDSIVFDPIRLQDVDDRLSLLYDLLRKTGAGDVAGLIAMRDELRNRLSGSVDDDLECSRLEQECLRLEKQYRVMARRLHDARVEAAPHLSEAVTQLVRSLEMPLAVFSVDVAEKDCAGRDGMDDIRLLFNANGRELQDLSRCASGGELSRMMLCIKYEMCRHTGMPTMIFDEIDTGVSGGVADKMGKLIVSMGSRMQVFAITHLPQVASKGDAHYLVYKRNVAGGATSSLRLLEGDDRLHEVARLLSGETLTAEAVANARVLLSENQ